MNKLLAILHQNDLQYRVGSGRLLHVFKQPNNTVVPSNKQQLLGREQQGLLLFVGPSYHYVTILNRWINPGRFITTRWLVFTSQLMQPQNLGQSHV